VDITIYLPDELGQRARDAKLPFSQLLRAAVIEQLRLKEAVSDFIGDDALETFQLELVGGDGYWFVGRFEGKVLATQDATTVYLTKDGRVVAHNTENISHAVLENEQQVQRELDAWLEGDVYCEAMRDLGLLPVVDL